LHKDGPSPVPDSLTAVARREREQAGNVLTP